MLLVLRAARAESIHRLQVLTEGFDGPIHIHVAEQPAEVRDCLAATGLRPVEWLAEQGLLDARWQLVHATHVKRAEIMAVAHSGSTVVTNNATTLTVRLNSGGGRRFMSLKVDSTPVAGDAAVFFPPTDPGTRVIAAPIDEVTLTPP